MKGSGNGAGLLGAALVGSLTVLPSLVPRAGVIQGLLMGTCAAVGYGLGCAGWRLTGRPAPRTRWWLILVPALALFVGWRWQIELADLIGTTPPTLGWIAIAAMTGAGCLIVVILMARGVRALSRRLSAALERRLAPRAARATAGIVTATVLLMAAAVLPNAVVGALHPLFARMNTSTPAGVTAPTGEHVSGGPRSAIPFPALGSQGQVFVAGATPTEDLAAFSGRPAVPPVRAFVGIDSAATASHRAVLAVEELERLGGFRRSVIAVGTSAGSGTVDPGEVTPLEYLLNGDVATVSTQYSVLPSFLSFLVDRPDSVEAARTLLAAVRARAAREPRPPRIVVFGESLGAYGSSSVFPDLTAVLDEVDGALWQGPPNASPLWRSYTAARQPASPQVRPVYDAGRHLRWANQPSDLSAPPGPFDSPRAVFLQNASDPVVWWDWSLLWQRPEWMAEPRGPGVLPWVPWVPLATFAGLTGDMINSQGVPAGHGHVYGTDPVYAWATILRPAGWSGADSARLAARLG